MSKKSAPKIIGYNEAPGVLFATPTVPKISGIKPTGSQILVELLTPQEVLGTGMIVGDQAEVGSPQAYILDFGPSLKAEEAGLQIGNRVLLQGSYVPVPKFDDNARRRGLVELHGVKAVLEEAK
jgi:co-chaperonin GroES (HSP10)